MTEQKHFFRVKYGYAKSDQVSIGIEDLEKAIYAQIQGKPIQLGNSYINGRNIISITPHYHVHTGWHPWFEPENGDDWLQVKRDCPNYDGLIEHYKERVARLISGNKENLIGKNVIIPELPTPEQKKVEQKSGVVTSIGEVIKKLSPTPLE
jgi:hypothetical protein